MASITSQIATDSIDQLEAAGFTVRRPPEVLTALAANPFLGPVLLEARRIIPTYFDLTEPVVLGGQYDWDAEEETILLYVHIPIRASYEEAYDRLRRLGEAWWDDAPDRWHDLLVIGISRTEPHPVD